MPKVIYDTPSSFLKEQSKLYTFLLLMNTDAMLTTPVKANLGVFK